MIDIEVEDPAWTDAVPEAEDLVRVAAEAALRALSSSPASAGEELGGLTILLTDDASVRELNAQFRHQDSATNVLSFPAPPNPEDHLGDVALAHGVCVREAGQQGKTLAHHLQHLVAHGVLHLVGYDHETDDEAEDMEGLERVVMAGLGAPDPYGAEQGDDG